MLLSSWLRYISGIDAAFHRLSCGSSSQSVSKIAPGLHSEYEAQAEHKVLNDYSYIYRLILHFV